MRVAMQMTCLSFIQHALFNSTKRCLSIADASPKWLIDGRESAHVVPNELIADLIPSYVLNSGT